MKTQTRIAFVMFVSGATLGVASLPLLVSAHEGGRDHEHEHDHDYTNEDELPEDPFAVESDEVAAPSQPLPELEVTPKHEPHLLTWPPKRLQRCTWRTEASDTSTGGVFALCELNEVPVGNGIHRVLSPSNPHHLVVLGFGDRSPEADGQVDGEYLSNDHPAIHGEPPADNRLAADYVLMTHDRGTAKHHIWDGVDGSNTVVTLCCEVSP
jgi:hypothetical protein